MSPSTEKIITGYTAFAGFVLLSVHSLDTVTAAVTQQGGIATHVANSQSMLRPAAWQYAAPQVAGPELVIGMLLLLLALAAHVFFVVRRQSNTPQKAPIKKPALQRVLRSAIVLMHSRIHSRLRHR